MRKPMITFVIGMVLAIGLCGNVYAYPSKGCDCTSCHGSGEGPSQCEPPPPQPPPNSPPMADAGDPYNGTVNEPMTFNGSGSSDPDGIIVSYDWDFGDGYTGTGSTPEHTYTGDGTYIITLTVTDDDGDSGEQMTMATIGLGNQAPIADAYGPYNGTVNEPVEFNGNGSSDSDGDIVAYQWTFGDNSTDTGPTPTHTYTTDGEFTVTLVVTDDAGDTGTYETTATIGLGNQAPNANANGPYNDLVYEEVTFDGSDSSDPDGSIVYFDWDFGDGSIGTGVTSTHTYITAGTYNVTLTVTDNKGATDSATTTVTIGLGNQEPNANAKGPYIGLVNKVISFDGSGSADPDGSIATYVWDFGDGNTGTGQTTTHTYIAEGNFTVMLTVTDDAGEIATDTTTATIGPVPNRAPISDAGGPYVGTAGFTVEFVGSQSSDSDGTIVSYDWDFGDDSSGTGSTPSYTYAAAGTYNVTLTVTDDMGATDSATTTAAIGQGNQAPIRTLITCITERSVCRWISMVPTPRILTATSLPMSGISGTVAPALA